MTASKTSTTRRLALTAFAAALATGLAMPQALAQEKVTYLFPGAADPAGLRAAAACQGQGLFQGRRA